MSSFVQKVAPLAGAAIGGYFGGPTGAAAGASAGSALSSIMGGDEANAQSLQSAREQMAFQERMSSTAYQRAVKDMQAAGLNPMLAFQQGGASTPGGASVQFQNAAGQATSSAAQAAAAAQSIQSIQGNQAQIEQIRATTDKIRSETLDNNLNTALAVSQLQNRDTETSGVELRNEGLRISNARSRAILDEELKKRGLAGLTAIGADAAKRVSEAERSTTEAQGAELDLVRRKQEEEFWNSKAGEAMPAIRMILEILRGISSVGALRR